MFLQLLYYLNIDDSSLPNFGNRKTYLKMDNNSFELENGDSNDLGHFSSSWNQILMTDEQALDEQTFNLMLTEEISNTSVSTFENLLANGQELIPVQPSQELLNIIKDEVVEIDPVTSTNISKPASLPASQNWPGEYGFNVGFNFQEKKTKGVTWTYNAEKNKLYVGKEAPCPINFSTVYVMPEGVQIRATALYSSPESASEVVERCMNHIQEDVVKDIPEAEHLVRCESPMAIYEVDPTTKRYSVIIPYDNPPPGQNFSTYIYKFACFGSCPGPNRRPLMLVFSLEKDNQCIGRQKIDVKICACPGRDSKTEEEQSGPSKKRKKGTVEPGSSHQSKKSRAMPDEDGHYKLLVKDRKCFEFLEQMMKYYNIMKTIKNMPPDVKRLIDQYQQRKGYRIPEDINLS
nr:cellular tumor antigen p53 isoform X2 [Parasteatoda tepidariorum]